MADRVDRARCETPAPQERVHVLHDPFDGQQQPASFREFTDPVAGMLHRLARRPAGEEGHRALPVTGPGRHQTVMKTKEIKSLASQRQVNNPGLGRLRFQTEVGQQARQPFQGGFGLPTGRAHHQRVVGIAHQHPVLPCLPGPVDPVQEDVGQQRRYHPALRSASDRPADLSVLHDSGPQHRAQKLQD